MTRGDFLGFGAIGTIVGAILTIPPIGYLLQPVIQNDVKKETNVPQKWYKLGPIKDIPENEPQHFEVDFQINQAYGSEKIAKKSGVGKSSRFDVRSAIYASWAAPVIKDVPTGVGPDKIGKSQMPEFVKKGFKTPLTKEQIKEAESKLNVMSNSCAHLGCPVRWRTNQNLFLCPCHGGLYDINGNWVGGPPPRGLYKFEFQVREDGNIYVKHHFTNVGPKNGFQRPFVV